MTEEEKEIVKEQVNFYKHYRELIQKGTFYRLISPFERSENETAWMVISKDRMSAIVGYYQVLAKPLPKLKKLPLAGLDPNVLYNVESTSTTHYGDELMHFGLMLEEDQSQKGDFTSQIFVLQAIDPIHE
ncbi:GH36 C-terminal domain-containing protein [Fervidibacillus albus]|uniref:GH36 C-terminal domain-containing protein n=1 Tax=Fervidibacillus albus TaxID=2980026 RepID=A0A9E8LXA9_9BACI|nr:GH36 C-terminal domain-containing protein [Fervidibacillus albus]WAA11286.1 GH36 C-terminal domain-containing protein [Fervidibacillus albus]